MDLSFEVICAYSDATDLMVLNAGVVLVEEIIEALVDMVEGEEHTAHTLLHAMNHLEEQLVGACLTDVLLEVRPIEHPQRLIHFPCEALQMRDRLFWAFCYHHQVATPFILYVFLD